MIPAHDLGSSAAPRHIVSDGDRAMERALDMAYGRRAPHQLCQFHLLREYTGNIGAVGFLEAKALLGTDAWIGCATMQSRMWR